MSETTYIALLRGINVGRAKQVSMTELRGIVESLGHGEVRTLLRSGNVVFRGRTAEARTVAAELEAAITARLQMGVRVVVRTLDELVAAVEANPIPEAARDGASLHVMFLERPLTLDERNRHDPAEFLPDVVSPKGREIYVWYRNGMSGSKTAEQLGRRIRTLATDRNWNTVNKLAAMARPE